MLCIPHQTVKELSTPAFALVRCPLDCGMGERYPKVIYKSIPKGKLNVKYFIGTNPNKCFRQQKTTRRWRKESVKLGDLVYIKWEDSQGCPRGWELVSEARGRSFSIIESVGWVMAVTKKWVQVVPHLSTFENEASCAQGHITIPQSGILKTRVLERATS